MAKLDKHARYILEFCDDESLDMLIYFRNPSLINMSKQLKKQMRDIAVSMGEHYLTLYYNKENSIHSELQRLGIQRIISFDEDGEDITKARAYYNPKTHIISLNYNAIDDIYHIILGYELRLFDKKNIRDICILHELFHHIEENFEQPVDKVMEDSLGGYVSPIFRDIAAYAFVNKATVLPPCQVIDFLWLCWYYPNEIDYMYKQFKKE